MIRVLSLAACVLVLSGRFAGAQQESDVQAQRAWYLKHYDFFSIPDSIYTFESEFTVPDGYRHADSSALTHLQNWVANFPLWHRHKPVGSWKVGRMAFKADEISRAVHLPWGGKYHNDLAIPLRVLAEYLHMQQRESDLAIILKMGETLRYEDWLAGKAKFTASGKAFIEPGEPRDPEPEEYYRFLAFCMQNSTYRSLVFNCDSIAGTAVAPGDLFVAHDERGRTGRVYVVMHMLVNDTGDTLYAVATGCEEACDFHIPLLTDDRDSPWVTVERIRNLGAEFSHSGFFRFKID